MSQGVDKKGSDRFRAALVLLVALAPLILAGVFRAPMNRPKASETAPDKTRAAARHVNAYLNALEAYRLDVDQYPSQDEGLAALTMPPPNARGWSGPYLPTDLPVIDPWGRAYRYTLTGDEAHVTSLGQDGRRGGKNMNADIKAPNLSGSRRVVTTVFD